MIDGVLTGVKSAVLLEQQHRNARVATTTAYDTLCGLPSSETDPNGIVTTVSYDALCRVSEIENTTTGHYKQASYVDEGNPASHHMLVKEPLPNAAGESFAKYYYDGRGRIWRTETSGETLAGAARRVDTDYDKRSNVLRKSHAYFAGGAPQWTTTTYDWADRPLTTTNPDSKPQLHLWPDRHAAQHRQRAADFGAACRRTCWCS